MSDIAIRVEHLSKQYKIGAKQTRHDTLRDSVMHSLRSGFQSLRKNGNGAIGQTDDTIWSLKDVSFEIKRGEVVGIIGRNGAGKSTLLKILSRITEPTEGLVEIHGRVASLLEVGTGFHPELTGRENIYLNGAILGMKRVEIARQFDAIVAFSEIEKFLDTPVKYYSSGMYVRLAFAVAAHLEPEILMVDEVLAVGDAQFQKKCLGKMGDVARGGRTVLFVSHNMTAVKSLCTRAIWLDKGVVVEAGEVSRVIDDYIQRGTSSVLERVWDDEAAAPGNDKVRVHSARVLPQSEDASEGISVETPLELEFEVWNYVPDAVLNFRIHIWTIDGIHVMAIGSDAEPRHRGLVKCAVKIPRNLLNDTIYNVSLQIVKDATATLYMHLDILVFEVSDTVRIGNWFGKWPGVIRPSFEWHIEDIESNGV